MKKTIQYLMLALAAQCLVLATVVFFKNQSTTSETEKLLSFDKKAIDAITLGDTDGELELIKTDDLWVLPAYENLSANQSKVDELLNDLGSLKTTWPIATSEAAAERFEVTQSNAQKSIKLKADQEIIGKVYFGTSPGYRKVHARNSTSDNIFAVEFPQYRASTKHEDWFDKTVLAYKGDIHRVVHPQTIFAFENNIWAIESPQPDHNIDSKKIETWIKNLNTLQTSKLVNASEVDKIVAQDAVVRLEVSGDNGLTVYQLFGTNEQYYIKSSRHPSVFEIAAYQAEKFTNLNVSDFSQEDDSRVQNVNLQPDL